MKCEKCGQEIVKISRIIKVPELKIEVETELHTKMESASKVKVPEGWRLLTLGEWIYLYNNYKDKINWGGERPDEIVAQPINENETNYPYWNVWFRDPGGVSALYGLGRNLLDGGGGAFGVRFCRDLKGETK